MTVVFASAPALGTRVWINDQRYVLVEVTPYTRKGDGTQTSVLTWEGECCAPGCGRAFRGKSAMTFDRLRRRCEAHKAMRSGHEERRRIKKHGNRVKVELA